MTINNKINRKNYIISKNLCLRADKVGFPQLLARLKNKIKNKKLLKMYKYQGSTIYTCLNCLVWSPVDFTRLVQIMLQCCWHYYSSHGN